MDEQLSDHVIESVKSLAKYNANHANHHQRTESKQSNKRLVKLKQFEKLGKSTLNFRSGSKLSMINIRPVRQNGNVSEAEI